MSDIISFDFSIFVRFVSFCVSNNNDRTFCSHLLTPTTFTTITVSIESIVSMFTSYYYIYLVSDFRLITRIDFQTILFLLDSIGIKSRRSKIKIFLLFIMGKLCVWFAWKLQYPKGILLMMSRNDSNFLLFKCTLHNNWANGQTTIFPLYSVYK